MPANISDVDSGCEPFPIAYEIPDVDLSFELSVICNVDESNCAYIISVKDSNANRHVRLLNMTDPP